MYTSDTVYRAGKIVGSLGRALDNVYSMMSGEGGDSIQNGYHKRVSFTSSIKDFCKKFAGEKLFDVIPGRAHNSYAEFDTSIFTKIKRPEALKARLLEYSEKLDEYRAVAGDNPF